MRTLRLLAWLRWTLFLRGHTVANRIGAFVLPLLFALVFAPFYLGGAALAFQGVMRVGAPAVVVALAICQLAWLYFGLLFGAMGRTFDLDRLLRFPLRPAEVYAVNTLAGCIEPVCLMTLPTVFMLALGAFVRDGLLAGAAVLLAGVLTTLVTSALLQLLLALLDELLRREWVRYVAMVLMSLSFFGVQAVLRGFSLGLAERFTRPGVTGTEMVQMAAGALAKVPTVGWPAAIGMGALDGRPATVALALAGTAALLAALLAPGATLMRHTARAGEGGGGGAPRGASARGSLAFPLPGLPRTVALLLARELRYTVQNPQRLVALVVTPLALALFAMQREQRAFVQPSFVVLLLGSAVTTAAITQFSFDGPGVRQFYLLPCAPRDVLLAKNLELFLRVTLQVALVFVPFAVAGRAAWTRLGSVVFVGAAAVVFAVTALGTYVSIRWPVKARRRGLSTRGDGGWGGLAMFTGTLAITLLVGASVWAAMQVAGPAYASPVGLAVAGVHLAIGAGLWWVSLDRNAAALREHREKLIEVLAKVEEV